MKREREEGQGRIGVKRGWGHLVNQRSRGDTIWGMLLPAGSEQDRTWLLEKTKGEKDEHRGKKNEI